MTEIERDEAVQGFVLAPDQYATRQEVADRVDHEGGLYEALVYGLKTKDMPSDDDDLIVAWRQMHNAFQVFEVARDKVDRLLEEGRY